MNLEQKEKDFLIRLLSQINISPAQKDAGEVVVIVQSIIVKLGETSGTPEVSGV